MQIEGVASRVLKENGVTADKVIELVNQLISPGSGVEMMEGEALLLDQKNIRPEPREAAKLKSQEAGTEHILIALMKESDCIAVRL